MPKTVDTRKHCKVGLRACNNLPQPPLYILVFWGCGRLLHALNPILQCFLVSTVFGTVSSLHLTSFMMYTVELREGSFKVETYIQALYMIVPLPSLYHLWEPKGYLASNLHYVHSGRQYSIIIVFSPLFQMMQFVDCRPSSRQLTRAQSVTASDSPPANQKPFGGC